MQVVSRKIDFVPPSILKCLEIIVACFKDEVVSIGGEGTYDRDMVFQRSLSLVIQYQPTSEFFPLASKSSAVSLFDSPFLSSDLKSLATSKLGSQFLNKLFSDEDVSLVDTWLKDQLELNSSTKALFQRFLYLKYYLTQERLFDENLVESDFLKAIPSHQKKAWLHQNLRYQMSQVPNKSGASFHLLTLHINNVLEQKRLGYASKLASSNIEPRALGKLLATSIFTCLEFNGRQFLSIFPENLQFLARYGAVLPNAWYTSDFMEVLFSRFLDEIELRDTESVAILSNILCLFSYWARRKKGDHSEVDYIHRMFILSEEMLSLTLSTPRSRHFKVEHLDSIIKSCLIIFTRLFGSLKDIHYTDTVQAWTSRILVSDVLFEISQSGYSSQEDLTLADIIQATMAEIFKSNPTSPNELIDVYLRKQTPLSLLGKFPREFCHVEQGIRVFNLFHFFTTQMAYKTFTETSKKVNKQTIYNPYAWSPFVITPQQIILDNFESSYLKSSAFLALGGSFLTIQKLPQAYQPSFQFDLVHLFIETINIQLDKFSVVGFKNQTVDTVDTLDTLDTSDPTWSAIAIVLSRCLDANNYLFFLNSLSSNTTLFLIQFISSFFKAYLPPSEKPSNYMLLSECPIFRDIGRFSKLIGRILCSHTEGNRMMSFLGARSLLGIFNDVQGPTYLSANERFLANLEALENIYSFSRDFYSQWDSYFNQQPREATLDKIIDKILDKPNLEGLRKCHRGVLFSFTTILQTTMQRLSTSSQPTDREIEISVWILSNLHFLLVLQSPRIMFNSHNDTAVKIFELVRNRPRLLSKLLKGMYPYTKLPLNTEEKLPAVPSSTLTFQSKELFYLWFLEICLPQLTGEQVENYVLPLLRPYITDRQPWSLDHFESSHAIILAMFKHTNHPIVSKFAPWYRLQLLEQFPKWLSTDQFRLAYLTLIEGLSNQEEVGGQTIWSMIRNLADKICDIDNEALPQVVPGYFQTFIKLLPNVPITYLPAFTHRFEELVKKLTSSKGGLGKEAAAKMAFDVVAQENLSMTHKSFAVPWYLEFANRTLPNRSVNELKT